MDSTTYKNRETLPKHLRDAFVIFADMGGLCVLDSRGSIRVFAHDDGREIEATDWVVRAALEALGRAHPEVAELLALTRKE